MTSLSLNCVFRRRSSRALVLLKCAGTYCNNCVRITLSSHAILSVGPPTLLMIGRTLKSAGFSEVSKSAGILCVFIRTYRTGQIGKSHLSRDITFLAIPALLAVSTQSLFSFRYCLVNSFSEVLQYMLSSSKAAD